MKPRALVISIALAGLIAALRPADAQPVDAARLAAGRQDFVEMARVLLSPRCMNCHPAGDHPFRGDRGDLHAMNVSRKSPAAGLLCTACHREHNSPLLHGPPGVHGWRMPSAEVPLVFEGKSSGELCRQLVDPKQNGGRTLAALETHMTHDELVLWGWEPGPGRTVPPLSHADFVTHVRGWVAAGAPCPP
jgi:hypothetical protein